MRLFGLIALMLAFWAAVLIILVNRVLDLSKVLEAISLPIVVALLVGIGVTVKRAAAAYGTRTVLAAVVVGIFVPLAGAVSWLAAHPGSLTTTAMQIVRIHALAKTRGPAWTEQRMGRMVVRYQADDPGAEEVLAVLPKSLGQAQAALTQLPDEVYVFVFPDRIAAQKVFSDLPDGFNGAGMGSDVLVMISPAAWSPEERATKPVDKTVAHEFTHNAVAYIGGPQVPKWLTEGLGVVIADQMTLSGESKLPQLVASGKRYSLAELNDLFDGAASLTDVGPGYILAGSVVQFMVDQYSFTKVQQVLAELGAGRSLDQALTTAVGTDSRGLESAWNQWLIAGGYTHVRP